MHENRETSETPVVQPDRRSAGEGQSHKARAYVREESHSGILPMNQVSARIVALPKASPGVSTYAIEFVEQDGGATNFWGISFPSNA
jgi:hypothetical protein